VPDCAACATRGLVEVTRSLNWLPSGVASTSGLASGLASAAAGSAAATSRATASVVRTAGMGDESSTYV